MVQLANAFHYQALVIVVLLDIIDTGKIINDLEVEFKRDERVIRWQTVKLEKFALEYAERRKKKMSTNTKAN